MPLPYRKRRGQLYVQTWHGTPLKRLGYDIATPSFASGSRYFDYLAGDAAQWDLLLSPNPFATPIFRQAFRYQGRVCETGYPRDDELLLPRRDTGRLAEIRRLLGLPADRKIRDLRAHLARRPARRARRYRLDFRLDLAAARDRLGQDYVLLIRAHPLMAAGIPVADQPGFLFDVSGYPDIADLLAVSDVLITDYSSVMFDFAPTGWPMLFFTYDLERYRDQLRGFYFDFSTQAPGPLLGDSAEVLDALADLDAVADRFAAARAAFTSPVLPA